MTNERSKRKIALIIPGGIGTGRNGIGIPVLERMIQVLASEFDLTVFQLFPVNSGHKIEGFELISIYSPNPILKIVKFAFSFIKSHRLKQFKAVHGFWILPSGFLAVLMGALFKIKSIVSVLGGDAIALPEIHYGQLRKPLYRKIAFWTLRHADEVNALTEYLVKNLTKAGLPLRRIDVIPWGIDTNVFSFQEKTPGETLQLLHVANLHPVKDQPTLLRAFKIISDLLPSHLTIIGEGVSLPNVLSLIDELALAKKVTIRGLIPYDRVVGYYHAADILLHTSLSEGQSEVVTEAMSCGVLVCGTDVGLIHDLHDCCIRVPVGDYQSLASECIALMGNTEGMKTLRTKARRWTTEHSITWTTEKIRELYR